MAQNSSPRDRVLPEIDPQHDPQAASPVLGPLIRSLLKPLASLKLTVVLFALAIFLVLTGTLAQIHKDIWEVVRDYFRTPVAWIEFRVFFPKSFFMGTPLENLTEIKEGYGFPFPGGWLIGGAMVVNLLAAHATRFKVQSTGKRLKLGLVVIGIGCAITTAVVLVGSLQSGQENQLLQDWPSLRILFQLFQGGLAGGVLLAGCLMVFRKRAGIVLLHGGVALVMFNELLVGVAAIEGQLSIPEGDTVNYVIDVRAVELAIVDTSDPDQDSVIAVPLVEEGVPTHFLKNGQVKHPDLPFEIEIVEFFRNSQQLQTLSQPDSRFRGAGRTIEIKEARAGTGTDTGGEVDISSAQVRLTATNQSDLGLWLVSQQLKPQTVTITGGKKYEVSLRFKRTYVPWSMHLVDVRFDKYIGTQTARNYSSDVRLVDKGRNVERLVHIWMNNPLRFAGSTFYQSSVNSDTDGNQVTGLQVVTNTGWMIPYVACMIVVIGMGYQFTVSLSRFQGRRTRAPVETGDTDEPEIADRTPASQDELETGGTTDEIPELIRRQGSTLFDYTIPAGIVFLIITLVGVYALSKTRSSAPGNSTADLKAFGRLPVVYQGRVKPFDTLARNSLRVISDKDSYLDEDGKRQPAIRWLLDEITDSPQAGTHQVFRIENLDVQRELDLDRRKGLRYSFEEIAPRLQKFSKQVELARKTPPEKLSVFQKKVQQLHNRVQAYLSLRKAHMLMPELLQEEKPTIDIVDAVMRLRELTDERSQLPLAVPSPEKEWEPLALASARDWCRQWSKSNADDSATAIASSLAQGIVASNDPQIEETVHNRVIATVANILQSTPDGRGKSERELLALAEERWKTLPAAMKTQLATPTRRELEQGLAQQLASVLVSIIGDDGLKQPPSKSYVGLANIFQAWKTDEMGTFNSEVTRLNRLNQQQPPKDFSASRVNFEHHFNHLSPFFLSGALYVLIFLLVCASWLGWTVPLNRTASWLMVATFLLHTYGLVARMYISERPPVTNLYSSAIFIGWGGVIAGIIIERVYRMGIGNVIGASAGFATMTIAHILAADGDTFSVLVAVLDTQFWLATHVVCITQGYTSTYVAGLLGVLFILRGVLTPSLSPKVSHELSRAIYGAVCSAMFFSFFGTVLGGLWADDSWGRFWGWDPKENGALIIVLWNALVLHARWGGMIRERGLAALAVVGNIVVSWSWFGVNELGVGLHSYGFTEGVLMTLGLFCLSQLAIIGAGCLPKHLWWSYRNRDTA